MISFWPPGLSASAFQDVSCQYPRRHSPRCRAGASASSFTSSSFFLFLAGLGVKFFSARINDGLVLSESSLLLLKTRLWRSMPLGLLGFGAASHQ